MGIQLRLRREVRHHIEFYRHVAYTWISGFESTYLYLYIVSVHQEQLLGSLYVIWIRGKGNIKLGQLIISKNNSYSLGTLFGKRNKQVVLKIHIFDSSIEKFHP